MSWSKPLGGFISQAEGDLNKRLRATALQALVGVVERSPVDEGTFRGNNHVSAGEPSDFVDEDLTDQTGSATIQAGSQEINKVREPFQILYIQNNLPYAVPLESGSSDQAPGGVFEITLNNLKERS